MLKHFILVMGLIGLVVSTTLYAETAEQKGLAIAKEADKRDTGFADSTVNMEMILINKQGQQSKRYVRVNTLEMIGDGDKSLSIFDSPRDIKGTAQLTFSHGLEPDEQWLYLPALKRVKRIASRNKSGSFMGSEFAFEDISSQEIEKYSYRYLGDETVDGQLCFKIERIPQYEYSGYKRQIVWMDQQHYRPIKIEFYDLKDLHLKTLTFSGYQQYLGQYWRADRLYMENHLTGKSTELLYHDYQFKTGLSDTDFTQNSLKRAH